MRKITLLMLCAMFSMIVEAKDISETEAQRLARSFLSKKSMSVGNKAASLSSTKLNLAYTAKSQQGEADLYVFNADDNGGFVIVSADDRTNLILGYSDYGTIDSQKMSENTKNWIQGYSDEIEYIRNNNIEVEDKSVKTISYSSPVRPLLNGILWNQDSPYNDKCPIYDIQSRCATGCVATAMAQVMYYNKWPIQGNGTHTYSPSILGDGTLTADFANTTYDWDNMLPVYDKNSSKESCEAVALLMLHCGISVDMEYYNTSGAASEPVARAFYTYFNYDRSVAYRSRIYYSSDEWQEIIINEIDNKRPIVALGKSSSGGHCFVFDGYDADGLIHVNWGWGGMSNGYFRTSALSPSTQGIGGSAGGFNYSQYIVTGIRRPQEDSEIDIELVSSEGLTIVDRSVNNGSAFNITWNGFINNAGWLNASNYEYGLILKDSEGKIIKTVATGITGSLNVGYEISAPDLGEVTLGQLGDGEYKLYPACRVSGGTGAWHRIRDRYVGYPNYVNISVSGNDMNFSYPSYFKLSAEYNDIPSVIYSKMISKVSATISNQGDVNYLGEVSLMLVDKTNGRKVMTGDPYKIDLIPGANIEIEFLNSFNVDAGKYMVTIVDDDERQIAKLQDIEVKDAISTIPELEAAEPLAFADPENVDPDRMDFTAKIRSVKGNFGGYAYLFIFNESGAVMKAALEPQYVYLSEGETADVTFGGLFENGVAGTIYQACLILNDGYYSYYLSSSREASSCTFRLGNGSLGVGNPLAEDSAEIKVYDINGRQVQLSEAMPHGFYIVKKGDRVYKIAK